MPTRITRSFSRKGLFGGRVRVTRSHTVGQPTNRQTSAGAQPPHVQVHLTGRDLIEMEQRQQEAAQAETAQIAQMHQDAVDAQTARMAALSGLAASLYRQPYAYAALGVFAVVTLVGLAVQPALVVSLALAGAVAVLDWGNLSTLHGRIHWRVLFATRRAWAWAGAVLMVLFYFVPVICYLVQNVQLAPSVAATAHARLQGDIARLEREIEPPHTA